MAVLTRREFIGGAAAVSAAMLVGSTSVSHATSGPLTLQVDARRVVGNNDPFWTGILFHPTEYLSTEWGRNRLREWQQTGAAQTYLRFYNQPEDAVRVASDGSITYDWEHFDKRADYVLELGLKPMVVFFAMPEPIAADPDAAKHRSFGKIAIYSPPKNYELWHQLCADFFQHVVQRYGVEEVATWRFTCWNEPNLGHFWKDGDYREYFKLYDYYADAAKGVSDQIQIGGPSYGSTRTYQHPEEWREFIEHVVSGTNYATGGTGAPIDYLSIHTYGASSGEGSPLAPQPSIEYIVAQQRRLAGMRDEYPKLRGLPLYVAEWGLSSGGTQTVDSKPLTVTRNSQYGAAFLAALVERLIAWRRSPEDPNIANLMFCPSGYEGNRCQDFRGRRTLDTVNGYHKPIWNGYKLLAKLGGELVVLDRSQDDDRVRAIATRDGGDRVAVLLTNFQASKVHNDGPSVPVRVAVQTSWSDGSARLKHWRVDETHSNAYTVFQELGAPECPNPLQDHEIRSRMDLELLDEPQKVPTDGSVHLPVDLPCNSVSLLELQRV